MLGLFLKDILVSKKYMKTLLLITGFYFIFGILTKNIMFSSYMVLFLAAMMTFTTFAYDENVKWDGYAMTFPITRNHIVLSKYLVSITCSAIGSIISLLTMVIYTSLTGNKLSFEDFVILGVLLEVAIIFCCFIIPIIFKFGIEKGRLLMFLVIAIPIILLYLLKDSKIQPPSDQTIENLLYLSPVITFVLVAISMIISIGVYSKKDL